MEIRSRHESRLVEVDSGRQREFESKLAEVMQQLRQDHEHQLQEYKEEMHKTFSSRVTTLTMPSGVCMEMVIAH